MNKIVNNNESIIYDSFNNYSNYNDNDDKYSFAIVNLKSSMPGVRYTVYGWTDYIYEYQMSDNGSRLIDNDTQIITIYYKIHYYNPWITLDKSSSLFENIKHAYNNFKKNIITKM